MKDQERPSQRLEIKDAPPTHITLEQSDQEPKENRNESND